MNQVIKISAFILLFSTLFSCAIEKRHYRHGFFIHKAIRTTNERATSSQTENLQITIFTDTTEQTSVTQNHTPPVRNTVTDNPEKLPETKKAHQAALISATEKTAEKSFFVTLSEENRFQQPIIKSATQDREHTTAEKITGLILCLAGLSPIGILFINGPGKDFAANLCIWLAAVIFLLVALLAIGTGATGGALIGYIFFVFLGIAFSIFAIIHGLVVFFRNI